MFALPTPADYAREGERLRTLVAEHRAKGREVVVVMGVGFVGAIMAAVAADSVKTKTRKPGNFVIAMQRHGPRAEARPGMMEEGPRQTPRRA